MVKNKINEKWHIDENFQIIKTSNGQPINTEEEPLFLLRGRDNLAIRLLEAYRFLAIEDGCHQDFLEALDRTRLRFIQFAESHPEKMKQPGITHGK